MKIQSDHLSYTVTLKGMSSTLCLLWTRTNTSLRIYMIFKALNIAIRQSVIFADKIEGADILGLLSVKRKVSTMKIAVRV